MIPDPNSSLTATTYRGAGYDEQHDATQSEEQAAAEQMRLALERFSLGTAAMQEQQKREAEDLKFQVAELQWPPDAVSQRSPSEDSVIKGVPIPGRPMLSLVTLNEPIQLVLNQERHATLGVQVHPIDEDSNDETASILQGIYRNIEQQSRAHIARSWAFNRAVKAGRGVYRVIREYDPYGGHPFDQRIVITRLLYQESAVFDPAAQQPDWSDGEWAFVTSDLRFSKYKQMYKDSQLASYSDGELVAKGATLPGWVSGESAEARTVRIAEYWRVVVERTKLVLLTSGNVAPEDKIPANDPARTGAAARHRYEEKRHVYWSIINCLEEIEPEQEWDGQYIPIIPVVGQEVVPFDSERRWEGMIHPAKDSARLVNYAASTAVEMAALEPKAPFIGEEGVFDGHEKEWAQANNRNWPFLEYNRIGRSGLPADKPQRAQVDTGRLGPSMQLLSLGRDFVQAATSTYDPALGKQPTAHRSGVAIAHLQEQTVESTSHYLDNMRDITMTYEAMVILDLIPSTYDRPGRVAQVLDEHDNRRLVMLNQPFAMDPKRKRPVAYKEADGEQRGQDKDDEIQFYNLNKGRYAVTVTIGKSHKSALDEGADEMGRILESDPKMMPLVGPEYFKYRDFPGHETVADILTQVRQHEMPWLNTGDEPTSGMKLQMAEQQMKAMKQQMEEMGKALETDKAKADMELEKVRMKFAFDTEIQKMKDATALAMKEMDLMMKGIDLRHNAAHERAALLLEGHEADRARAHEAALAIMQAQGEQDASTESRAHEVAMAAQQVGTATDAEDRSRAHEIGMSALAAQQPAPPPGPPPPPEGAV